MSKGYRVFVSSTSDLGDERETAIHAIRACDCTPNAMEDWCAGDKPPLEKIYKEIQLSDFFILLLGARYGDRPKKDEIDLIPGTSAGDNFSYVRAEYNYALKCRKPILALLSTATYHNEIGPIQADEDARLQDEFRLEVRHSLVTKTWRSPEEIAKYVTSSLHDRIRPLEAAMVVQTNADLISEVSTYLNTQKLLNVPAKSAVLVQYSSRNVRDILRKLLWSGVETKLYIVSNKYALRHQRRIIEDSLQALTNHLDPIDPEMTLKHVLSLLQIYRYDAPGSIRTISIDDGFLAVGSYVYMMKRRSDYPRLDIRGGELPMIIFQKDHAGFSTMQKTITGLINNWHKSTVAHKWPTLETNKRF
jgi:hypothetical protein